MAMASPSTSTAGPDTAPGAELSRLGGIEDLRLKVGPVRRSLFGPVDHQQLRQDFQRLLCVGVEAANKRWNFDFQGDVPGPGSSIEWEELKCKDVPTFYRSRMVRPAARPVASASASSSSSSSSSTGEGSPMSSSSSGSGDEYLEVTTRGCYRIQRTGKRRQASITDFFKVKKRKLLYYKTSMRQ